MAERGGFVARAGRVIRISFGVRQRRAVAVVTDLCKSYCGKGRKEESFWKHPVLWLRSDGSARRRSRRIAILVRRSTEVIYNIGSTLQVQLHLLGWLVEDLWARRLSHLRACCGCVTCAVSGCQSVGESWPGQFGGGKPALATQVNMVGKRAAHATNFLRLFKRTLQPR
jgi:hypothetical protein